ncbi:MAG: hypothetical protein A2X19_09400 [Bacteroidetes bacterium GWE2_39_28]|nr:MAG: hypothetical protein A2X19_09400 [Bacteroidetes bacterium GWE2_39_28]OFY11651.1 MAG: hypothetical protein A2X16_03390 [Bacteroidetes bacterium GWF2_39_10]OFZ11567.1 MAG: hypothetical protein A2465_04550 [Bacteroidetes bacterium RIFOXYC2_FULL_39_11]HCT94754.1 hypothetical protein [Rikenellaceae bacterium]HCV16240.1 hypothetical protein [Rikenellaceae bacterium]
MALEITGTLIKKLDVQTGNSARGEWQKQEFIIETTDNFPKKVCLNVWGPEKVSEISGYREGEVLKISFNAESREFNQRWYTDLRAWKIERADQSSNDMSYSVPESTSFPTAPDTDSDTGEDDLPF